LESCPVDNTKKIERIILIGQGRQTRTRIQSDIIQIKWSTAKDLPEVKDIVPTLSASGALSSNKKKHVSYASPGGILRSYGPLYGIRAHKIIPPSKKYHQEVAQDWGGQKKMKDSILSDKKIPLFTTRIIIRNHARQ